MLSDAQQLERRGAIVRILREVRVGKQRDLVRLLKKAGHDVNQSSVSRDLRDLGVAWIGGRYVLPRGPGGAGALESQSPDLAEVARFLRAVKPAGPHLTVVLTAPGAAQSVGLALDRAAWPEVVGTMAGDDTVFVATASARHQQRLVRRLERALEGK